MRTFRTLFFIEIKLMCSTKGFQLDAQTDRNLWMGSRDPENLDLFKKNKKLLLHIKGVLSQRLLRSYRPIYK